MNALTVTSQPAIADIPSTVSWQEAIEPFLNTLDSPRHGDPTGGTLPK